MGAMAENETTETDPSAVTEQATTLDQTAAPLVADDTQGTQEIALGIWDQVVTFGEGLMRPWNAYQVAIALVLLAASLAATQLLRPRLYEWMKDREGWPKWRYRYLVTLHRRMPLVLFFVLIWLAVWIMHGVTWPSHSYLLLILANLSTAWLVVVVIVRLVNNAFLRGVLRYGAWIWVTLSILGLSEEAMQLMDSAAIELGDARISLLHVAQGILMLGVTITTVRFLSRQSTSTIQGNDSISPTMQVLIIKVLQVTLYALAFIVGLRTLGFDLRGLAVLSGFIGVGLGFGLQKVVSNLVSGIIILLDKSIKPGDVISLGETFGWINALGARYVSVVTRDGREYLIPNEDLITGQVVNWSHTNSYVRLDIFFGTAYGDDPHKVRKIAVEAAQSVGRVLTYPNSPVCHIVGFGDSSVDYILRFWIEDPTKGLTNIRGNVYLALWDAFHAQGISIPFPQREMRILDQDDRFPIPNAQER